MGRTAAIWAMVSMAGSPLAGQQYPFLPVPGGPKNVQFLFQDSLGRLWLGGDQLACFDGSRFFFARDYGFPDGATYGVAEDRNGAIWVAADTGIYRFADGRFSEISRAVAVSIAVTSDVVLAAAGPAGQGAPQNASLLRIERSGNGWKTDIVAKLDSPGPITLDPYGMILYPYSMTQWREMRVRDVLNWRPGKQIEVIRHGTEGGRPINGPWQIVRDRAGYVWFASPANVVYEKGSVHASAPAADVHVHGPMHETANGDMVLPGGNVVAVGRPGHFRIATRANGLPGVLDAIEAKDGTIWLGTTNGLYRFPSPFQIESWTIREGLTSPPWSVARLKQNMFAGLDDRVVRLTGDRQRWETITKLDNVRSVSALLDTGRGTLMAGFADPGGNIELSPSGTIVARTVEGSKNIGMRLCRTPDGTIWTGRSSVARLVRNGSVLRVESHTLRASPAGNLLAIKYEEQTRKLWACYNGGLLLGDLRGNWREYTTSDGLKVNGCWSLAPLANGDIWYAYYNYRAIARIRPDAEGRIAVRNYERENGVPDPASDVLEADRAGRLWRSWASGIGVASASQAEAGEWLSLDQSDGFPANDMNSGSVFVDVDGSLWWGADDDLAHYTPAADLVAPQVAPQVFVSAFSWENQPPRLAESVMGMPHARNVMAYLGSLQFDRRSALRVRYRVLPGDSKWRETSNLDLALGSLGSGRHTLELQARVFTGPWSATASRSFLVSRPAWASWPLLVSYTLSGMLLLSGAFLLRRRFKTEAARVLPDLSSWRMEAFLPEVSEVTGTLLDGRFEIGELLARGGFANVMCGYDRERQQSCVVKLFRSEVRDKRWLEHRFEQEVAALQKIHHPNVVSIYAHGTTASGAPYLVMEFVEGQSLREILKDGPLPSPRTARFLRQIGSALDTIHALGIWHRDLKPENIMVRDYGSANEMAVLIDFSIAIVKDANESLHGLSRAAGTFEYMAPEQAVGYAEASSDIYGFAKVVIEMLTGRKLSDLLPQASIDLPHRVRELLESMSLGLSSESIYLLASAFEFDPSRRPDNAGAFTAPLVRDLECSGQMRIL